VILTALLLCTVCDSEYAQAQSKPNEKSPTPVQECTKVTVDFTDDPSLTREEKLALMNKALFKSLSQYDECQMKQTTSSGAATSSGGGTLGESGSGQEGETIGGGTKSVASSDMSGEENLTKDGGAAEKGTDKSSSVASATSKSNDAIENDKRGKGKIGQPASARNGKIPEDIPSVDNDNVLEAQIRQAAIDETDPKIKKTLWNEYRKYKGLPLK
tara:strand:+ start:202 stop:846 length:645 start_codon:yes stop_codon:yes gene_type:complete